MTLPETGRSDVSEDLRAASALVSMGMPVFVARLDRSGNPMPPPNWEKTRPDRVLVNRWRPGLALCAVTGVVFDVIDIDPRNGGKESFAKMATELGEDGPEVFWRVKTPSGGLHLYVATMGLRKCKPLPGIDIQAGNADGEGRGFVFLPPTVRPSKTTGKPVAYAPTNGGPIASDDTPCTSLVAYVERCLADRPEAGGGLIPGGRQTPDVYRAACLGAPKGSQRDALLRYVQELERRGYDQDDIVSLAMGLALEMPNHNPSDPYSTDWRTEKYIRSLFHRRGAVVPDATPEETAELSGIRPVTGALTLPASSIEDETMEWLWEGYLAFREMTLLDGEKGMGKSAICDDVIARATRGRAMPGAEEALCGPLSVMLFTEEGSRPLLKKRLRAAEADLDRVFFSVDKPPKRGTPEHKEWELALPGGAAALAARISECGARLVIFDPIKDYLASDINTNNDASVRLALRPLAVELAKLEATCIAIRHMNKNKAMEAKFRGGGTTAFQNRSRVHLVIGEIPSSAGVEGKYGLAMVDTNLTVRRSGVLCYSIVDSDVELDDRGNMVGRCEWHDYADVSASAITGGEPARHGPAVSPERMMVTELLREMFAERDTWPVPVIHKELTEAGYGEMVKSHKTMDKIRAGLGIRSERVAKRGAVGGVQFWNWTTRIPEGRGDGKYRTGRS